MDFAKRARKPKLVLSAAAMVAAIGPASAQDGGDVVFISAPINNLYQAALDASVQTFGAGQGFNMLPSKQGQTYEAAEQVNNMNTMLDAGVRGIVLQVVDGKGMKTSLDKAEAAGIPVVSVDAAPDDGYGKLFMMVQVSSEDLGRQGCEALGAAMGGKGKILELQGSLQAQVGVLRSKGFNDCIKANFPEISVVSQVAEWSSDKAASITETVLSTDPEVNGIFMAGDAVYVNSVLNVMRRQDRLHPAGEEGHIALAGIDGDPAALDAIRQGYMDATVEQPLTAYGKWAAFYMKAALEGRTFEPGPTDHGSEIIRIGENLADVLTATVVTAENVDSPDLWANLKQ